MSVNLEVYYNMKVQDVVALYESRIQEKNSIIEMLRTALQDKDKIIESLINKIGRDGTPYGHLQNGVFSTAYPESPSFPAQTDGTPTPTQAVFPFITPPAPTMLSPNLVNQFLLDEQCSMEIFKPLIEEKKKLNHLSDSSNLKTVRTVFNSICIDATCYADVHIVKSIILIYDESIHYDGSSVSNASSYINRIRTPDFSNGGDSQHTTRTADKIIVVFKDSRVKNDTYTYSYRYLLKDDKISITHMRLFVKSS